jgi:hypothetical protein
MTSVTEQNCPKIKTSCANSDFVKRLRNILKEFKTNSGESNLSGLSIISQKDIQISEDALDKYLLDCERCGQEGLNDYRCMEAASNNLQRRLPQSLNSIYPWKNYDWNYGNYVSNNYSPERTGATTNGTFAALFQNTRAISKVINGIISDPIPNPNSKAGVYGQDSDYPKFESCQDGGCITTQNVRNSFTQDKPTNDSFLDKDVNGVYSSSYYFKVGSCPRGDIKNQTQCENNKYTWSGKSCYQPRYAFIDNSPNTFFNGSNAKGFLPSMASDISNLMPDKVLSALMGESLGNSYIIQPCPTIKESFQNMEPTSSNNTFIISSSIFILLTILLFYKKIIIN